MFCWKCGAEVSEGKKFCSDCGTMIQNNVPQNQTQNDYQTAEQQNQQYQPSQTTQQYQATRATPPTQQCQATQATLPTQPNQQAPANQPVLQYQPAPQYQVNQAYTTPVPNNPAQPQNGGFNQPNPQIAKAEKAYKSGKTMSNITMIMGLVSLGMFVFGILFWPFYFFLYVVGIATLIMGFFAKRNGLDYKEIEGYKDKFKKNKSSVKLGKGLALFSMITPIVLVTTVVSLLIYVASQLIGHTSEIITQVFSAGGISEAFDNLIALVSDLNDSGALLKILSILGILIKFI